MRTIVVSRRMPGWLGLLATVAVAGCTATSTSSPAALGHGRSTRPAPTRPVMSQTYAVSISIPVSWQPTPYLDPVQPGYDGTSGWVQLNAMVEPFGLRYACTVATGNVLHPYGLRPQIIYRNINGRSGCLILPSSDAPARAQRAGGPAFQTSSALVEYRQPIHIGSGTYALLLVDADPSHLVAIADSVQLHH